MAKKKVISPIIEYKSPQTHIDFIYKESWENKGESILFIDSLKDDAFYDLYSRRKMYLSK